MDVTIQREGAHWRLEATQTLPAPLERVFPFFADAHNLEKITPSFLKFNVLTPAPIDMKSGALIDYKLKVRGVPIRWRTEIESFEPPHRFVDTQLRGPYALWHHTHTFEDLGGATKCVDLVKYRPMGGPLAPIVNTFFVQRDVVSIFKHRMRVLDEMFSGGGETAPAGAAPSPA